jgi:hypothetical protein
MLRSLAHTVRALGSMPSPPSAGLVETIISALRTREGREAAPTFLRAVRPGRRGRRWIPRGLILSRVALRRTWLRVALPIGLLLGVVLSLVNQGGMLLSGRIDVRMCVICGLDFLVPLAALSVVLLAVATRDGSRG